MKFFGIPVRFDGGSIILILLIGLNAPSSPPIIMPVVFVALFLFSLLFHERAHVLAANRFGIGCDVIIIQAFGGLAMLTDAPSRPRDSFIISAAGPAASFLLAGAFFALGAYALPVVTGDPYSLLSAIAGYFARINIAFAVFNLIPIFPLDGGQMLFSVIWRVVGNETRAIRAAITAGRVVMALLMGALIAGFALRYVSLFSVIWIGLIFSMVWRMQESYRSHYR